MRRFVTATFHSNLLIPEKTIEEAKEIKDELEQKEKILLWIDTYQANHFLRSGDVVYHVDNISQKMFVDKIIRKSYGEEKRQKIVGVDVHFWEELPDTRFI